LIYNFRVDIQNRTSSLRGIPKARRYIIPKTVPKRTGRPRERTPEACVISLLRSLAKLKDRITSEKWHAFIPVYAEYYIYACNLGEEPCSPGQFFIEWDETHRLGLIEMDNDFECFYLHTDYRQYSNIR